MTPCLLTPSPLLPPLLLLLLSVISFGPITQTLAQNSGQVTENSTLAEHATGKARPVLHMGREDYYIRPSVLRLECISDSDNVTFWKVVNEIKEQLTVQGPAVKILRFEMTPEREGAYYCTVGGVRSDPPLVEVVAYPIPNRTIKAIKTHTARLNTDVTMPCVFSPGVLSQRYSIQWFNGLSTINTTDSRLSITSDFSLVINNVNALDASSAYYCVVDVENDFFSYHSIGPSVELLVTDSLSITHPPVDVVHIYLPTDRQSSVVFTCTAFGVPPPSLTWLHQGKSVVETTQSQVYSLGSEVAEDGSGTTVTSELRVTDVIESHSGLVECLVTQHAAEGGMALLSRVAHLTVLPSSFRPTLLPTSVGVELSAIFPALLPTSFSLVIYYYDRDTSDLVGKSELFDLSFSNTRTVDYLISADKMPPVLSFSVRIAVKVGGIEGDSSSSSNTITVTNSAQLSGSSTSSQNPGCDCSDTTPDDTTVQTVLVIFIVFLIVLLTGAVGVAVWGIVLMVRGRMRNAGSKNYDGGSYYSDKSRSRSRSYSSYRSRSHSSMRSRSRSYSRSLSPGKSNGHSYRSGSRGHTPFDSEGAPGGGREDPEGSYADEYVPIKGAPTDLRGRAGSASSGRANIIARPLPTQLYRGTANGAICHVSDLTFKCAVTDQTLI